MKTLPNDPGYMGDASRGASLGRGDKHGTPASLKFSLQRVPLDSGGYDSGGAYWGIGAPLYWAASDDGEAELFFRVDRGMISEAFKARGGVPIGEPGYDAFRAAYPSWSRLGTRYAAKDHVSAEYPGARFYS